ncbi:hypothetical protein MNEG_11303 [Monoraphidium neglectum]|uniref:Uncharacterized protein n=1 Tax=Monoraphidium neglectum TaxID=145388 RepID=A0A0D2LZ71_9CHLO|nr:hypothetical protein MNEG_11303 [Monoraphidium neglectum]KIY96659.1 hypothetical protein MNEG_11303 [Monoraphidium neglectum]|eukprot:XP_013895679.1 hypothetical protein MNEG_11303 [Monoraphidium neglectum]
MPVIPEKRQLDARVRGALGAQFWAQPVESGRAVVGATAATPCEPPPLPLAAPSGLSRTQLLVAAQAAGLPFFPGWCEAHGGTVLDRVLVQTGRKRWWGALTGRLKAQRMVGQRGTHTLREVLQDPENYALAASGRVLLSEATTLRASAQADRLSQLPSSLAGWRPSWRRKGAAPRDGDADAGAEAGAAAGSGSAAGGGGAAGPRCGPWAALQLKQQLLDGYELTADLALNEPSLDGVRASINTPLRLSVDVGPRPGLAPGPLMYRVGAHGVLAPAAAEAAGGGGGRAAHVLAAHAQGALALAGGRTLWQAASKPWERSPRRGLVRRPLVIAPLQQQQQQATASPSGDDTQRQGEAVPPAPHSSDHAAATAPAGDDGPRRRHPPKPRRHRGASGAAAAREGGAAALLTPGQVQDGLQQTTWRLERLRTDLQSWAGRANAGELLPPAERPPKGAGAAPGGCWSSVLQAPHLRVSGLVGALGRVPLHHSHFDAAPESPIAGAAAATSSRRRGRRGAGAGADGAAAGGAEAAEGAPAPPAGPALGSPAWLRHAGAAGRGFAERVVFGGLGGLGGLGSHLARDVGVRLFASGGAALQLGRMRRNFLDFTRLEATLDAGLTGPKVLGSGAGGTSGGAAAPRGGGGARHPAFALDDTGAWHALTLSASQQLAGPVRLRADWRLALDSAAPLPGGGPGLGGAPQAAALLARHVGGMRPTLLDAAYGLDVIVPGSGGLVRAVAWYSPRRGEGALEVRLL